MENVVGIRFAAAGKIYDFKGDESYKLNDQVVVETSKGLEIGFVAVEARTIDEGEFEIKPILRHATKDDLKKAEKNAEQCKVAIKKIKEIVKKLSLDMKINEVSYTLDASKMYISFISEDRVDFRDLIKELITIYHCKIELRQIGARDDVKAVGGLGVCGKECCCKQFLNDFEKVSIKMAKTQNLSLNPTKISGLCGKLMCCLNYENDFYSEQSSKMPRVNSEVKTPDGNGIVMYNNLLKEVCTVKVFSNDGAYIIREYSLSDLSKDTDNGAKRK